MFKRAARAGLLPGLIVSVVLVGAFLAPVRNSHPGFVLACYPICPVPTVTNISPPLGPTNGGTTVTITGTSFNTTGVSVSFGGTPATSFVIVSDTQINAVSPAHAAGPVNITVTTAAGTSAINTGDLFTFTALVWYVNWFDKASTGMMNDNIHLLNTSGSTAHIAVTLGGTSLYVTLAAGATTYVSFGFGTIGGPVVISADQQILASQRIQFFSSFNEVWAESGSLAATYQLFNWYDKASTGFFNDNIHVLNPGTASSTVTVRLGSLSRVVTVAPGQETYTNFPQGSIGGPVIVTSTSPVLASQRVQFNSSFNEEWAETPAQASMTNYINWFDKASDGMLNDNIHLLNTNDTTVTVTLSLSGASNLVVVVPAGIETYAHFPQGTIGGPVKVSSTLAILAAQRVQFYSTFNEVWAKDGALAATTLHFTWYDKASDGMLNDNIHLLNPGGASATVTVTLGSASRVVTVAAGAGTYVNFAQGSIGGPVTVTSTAGVLTSQRVQFYQSFNEIWGA